jgi:beta-N-acetylhexosaminidase
VRSRLSILLMAVCASCATVTPHARDLTLDEKIGQLFVVAAHGIFMNEQSPEYAKLVHQVRDNHVGGIIWFVSNVYETALLNRHLQELASVPLLVSSDLEAGSGMRFEDTTYWPYQMAVAATGDPSLAEQEGRIVALEAGAIGVNQILAPVADVNVDPANPVINVRSYGEDPAEVARFVAAFVRGVESGGVIATVKHFPGHGDTRTDSHRSLPILRVSRERLEAVELVPFRAALEAGARSVMVAHLSIPELDPTPAPPRPDRPQKNAYVADKSEVALDATAPASLSPKIVDGLLRAELKFQGLVVTDALDMGGITDHFEPGEAAVRAILAGGDQILKSPDTDSAIAAVRRAVETGRISPERLDQSVRRILEAKSRFRRTTPDPERIFRLVDDPRHRALAEEIARRAVTLLREEPGRLPLGRSARLVHIAISNYPEIRNPAAEFSGALAARTATPPSSFLLDARAREEELQPIFAAAREADLALVTFHIRPRSEEGRIQVPETARKAIARLADTGLPLVSVSLGSPYVLGELPELKTYAAAYGGQPVMQVAAVRALFGETSITGHLPVTIPGIAPRGSGIQKTAAAQGAAPDFSPSPRTP